MVGHKLGEFSPSVTFTRGEDIITNLSIARESQTFGTSGEGVEITGLSVYTLVQNRHVPL